MSNRPIIVIGHRGQDGRILTELLDREHTPWVGVARGCVESSSGAMPFEPIDIADEQAMSDMVAAVVPSEVYYLAAVHGASDETEEDPAELMRASIATHATGWINCLEAVRTVSPDTRLVYAASSLVFGGGEAETVRQDESTPWRPVGVYGLTKALGWQAAMSYRERFGLRASVAILYNHESVYRSPRFLTRRVIEAAIRIGRGSDERIRVGNLDAVVDWSAASDVVDAMRCMAALDQPADCVVASGTGHTVREWIEVAFGHLGLDWKGCVVEDPGALVRRPGGRIGDPSKLESLTGWRTTVSFERLVEGMVDALARTQTGPANG